MKYKFMTRLSLDEAKEYVPLTREYRDIEPTFYSMEEGEDGWDKITYYIDSKLGTFEGKEGDEFVYVLSNPSIPGMYKIGYTSKTVENRTLQINRSTGVPTPFNIEFRYKCYKGERIEREVHKFFKKQRVNNDREFFKVSLEEAKTAIRNIGEKYI
jgi:hypothetical protein